MDFTQSPDRDGKNTGTNILRQYKVSEISVCVVGLALLSSLAIVEINWIKIHVVTLSVKKMAHIWS